MKRWLVLFLALLMVVIAFIGFLLASTTDRELSKEQQVKVTVLGNRGDIAEKIKKMAALGEKGLCHPASPFGECLPPDGSIWSSPRETLELKLSSAQVIALLETFKPKYLLITDIRAEFSGTSMEAEAVSLFPIAPGLAKVMLQVEDNVIKVNKLTVDGIEITNKLRNQAEDLINSSTINALSEYGVTLQNLVVDNEMLYVKVETPKGLVKIEDGGNITINLETITKQERLQKDNTATIQK